MIYSKDRVTRETLMTLIAYSQSSECRFLTGIKPPTNIVNDWEIKEASIVSFLKIEEKVFNFGQPDERGHHGRAFSVKVLVDDQRIEWIDEAKRTFRETPVPPAVLNRVSEILNAA